MGIERAYRNAGKYGTVNHLSLCQSSMVCQLIETYATYAVCTVVHCLSASMRGYCTFLFNPSSCLLAGGTNDPQQAKQASAA
jgi:hypothetical protein